MAREGLRPSSRHGAARAAGVASIPICARLGSTGIDWVPSDATLASPRLPWRRPGVRRPDRHCRRACTSLAECHLVRVASWMRPKGSPAGLDAGRKPRIRARPVGRCRSLPRLLYRMRGQIDLVKRLPAQGARRRRQSADRPAYLGSGCQSRLAWVAWREGRLADVQAYGAAALAAWQRQHRRWRRAGALSPAWRPHLAQGQDAEAIGYARRLLDPKLRALAAVAGRPPGPGGRRLGCRPGRGGAQPSQPGRGAGAAGRGVPVAVRLTSPIGLMERRAGSRMSKRGDVNGLARRSRKLPSMRIVLALLLAAALIAGAQPPLPSAAVTVAPYVAGPPETAAAPQPSSNVSYVGPLGGLTLAVSVTGNLAYICVERASRRRHCRSSSPQRHRPDQAPS